MLNMTDIHHMMLYDAVLKRRVTEQEQELRMFFKESFKANNPMEQELSVIDKNHFSYDLGTINYGGIKQKSAHCTRIGHS